MKRQTAVLILIFYFIYFIAHTQDVLPKAEKMEVIDSITKILDGSYIFPDIAENMNQLLRNKLASGAYDGINDPNAYADILTKDVQSISKDKHLRISFDPEMISSWKNATTSQEDSIDMSQRQLKNNRMNNYGFQEVKILDGNIGYLKLSGFFHVDEEAGATAQAAMNLLSNADALIIDLRQNGGGSPSMIQLISSYLFGTEPVHLNSFYYRPADQHTQTWTLPYVPGKRRPDIDVYVLTSSRTFSAAEEFSYNLLNLKRATLVGETTGGGAHPGGTRIATDRFTVWVPTGRAINPITNTNWEGTGVKPHIEVSSNEALDMARIKALETLMEKSDSNELFSLQWAVDGLRAEKDPYPVDDEILKSYTGSFGPRNVNYRDGKLYYQREGNPEYLLTAISEDTFMMKEIPTFRIKIIKKDGRVTALQGLYNDGRVDKNLKTTRP